MESTFPVALDKNDFSVNLTSKTNSSIWKPLKVVRADDAAKTITCMFGGAESNNFYVSIRHSSLGLINTSGLEFSARAQVFSISPMSGSINGGTILTIMGENFGTEITDNPV